MKCSVNNVTSEVAEEAIVAFETEYSGNDLGLSSHESSTWQC